MTITTATDCTYVRIESTLIDDYVSDQTNKTLTLSVYNCTDTEDIVLELADLTVGSPNYYELVPEDIGQTTEFTNSIYKYTVLLEETGEDDQEDIGCNFVKCGLNCDIISYYMTNGLSMAHVYYTILSDNLNACTECDCDDACQLWADLNYILTGEKIKNCSGCSV